LNPHSHCAQQTHQKPQLRLSLLLQVGEVQLRLLGYDTDEEGNTVVLQLPEVAAVLGSTVAPFSQLAGWLHHPSELNLGDSSRDFIKSGDVKVRSAEWHLRCIVVVRGRELDCSG
jgi:hypothetical protein